MLIGVSIPNKTHTRTMFAHLRVRVKEQETQETQEMLNHLATNMRDNVRNQRSPLNHIYNHNHPEISDPLAEIYMREFACLLQTLKQVNHIANRYHEHAFDNVDAYIGQDPAFQSSPDAMTAEQRHASQLLLGVGNNYSEINVALKMLRCGILIRDITECDDAKIGIVAQQFGINPSVAEDAFDRLCHMTKQVWSLVNMLAFSNLFRFADPKQPIFIANPEDTIFIPHIPMKQEAQMEAVEAAAVEAVEAVEAAAVEAVEAAAVEAAAVEAEEESGDERYWLQRELNDWTADIRKRNRE